MPEAGSQASMEESSSMGASLHTNLPNADFQTGAVPSSSLTGRSAYLPQLDGLRAFAILMVFVHHAYAVPLLWSGVDLFFILSGFLITNILLRDSARMRLGPLLKHFYVRRAQRILPAYVVCLALVAVFTVQDWHRLWPFYAFFLQNLPYAFRWIGFSPLIPLWSLAVEQHFYLFWPFLVYWLPRRYLGPCMIVLLLGSPLLRAVCTPLFAYPEAIYVLTPFRLDAMAAGALAAVWLPICRRHVVLRWAQLAIPLGLVAYALLSLQPGFRRSANTALFNSLAYSLNIVIFGGLFLWSVLAKPESPLVRLLSSRPMRNLGRISYAFYLFHFLMLTRFAPYFPPHLAVPITFLLTVALATLSWYAIEKPLLALGGPPTGAAVRPQRA